ncbi:hypothetical protein [Roseisolibacter agri]|uniref:Uncharacterized protein n=1 Tax=Roseisolibacter agri TaxID=2014610 RepID=A0AA37Q3J6_9BACT|nr:hypothetical protein [Roseisolibacter agri]GLC25734.1 hypothetical protein rosag_22470 [Roseisolibacter agri]
MQRSAHTAALTAVTLAACGGSEPTRTIDTPPIDTTTLVGTWIGTLDGGSAANSYGSSGITIVLRADSTLTAKATNPLYCDLSDTRWRVTGTQFTANGRDCDGVVVTFAAPVGTVRLTGTWTASSGRAGTFTIAKQ